MIKNLKKNRLWKNFLRFIFKPFYEFIWKNIINIHGRFLYILYFLINPNREYISLENNDKKLVNHTKITDLAIKISESCTENLILKTKNKLNSILDKETNETNSLKNKYKISLLEELDKDLKKEIMEFGMSELLVSTAAKHLGVFPILSKVALYLNIPSENKNPRGAMLWHKDDFGYKSLDLFVIITDVDNSNGPLLALDKKNSLGVLQKIYHEKQNPIRGERGKIDNDIFEKNFPDSKIIELSGKIGNALLIDSFTVYHKGGHCSKNHRIMLRYSYQTIDSVRLPKNQNNLFFYSGEYKKNSINNIFLKYLLFKRSFILDNFKINTLLLKIYRIIGYKI